MRLRTLIKLLALGLVARAIVRTVRERRARVADAGDPFARDPGDPVQGFDELSELQVMPLEVDAQSLDDVEAAQDLARLELEVDQIDEVAIELVDVHVATAARDAGDLYGVHTPIAVDRDHPDSDRSFDEGQNWLEALETSAVENGAEPERSLDDIIDDEDVLRAPHASDLRDTPIADLGSGGRRGL